MKVLEGGHKGKGKKYAVVVSRFNDFISRRLLEGCLRELRECGVPKSSVTVAWVPGSVEIPVTALRFAKKKTIDAVICLGAVIRGETYHFEMVCRSVTDGITQAALLTGKPVVFGVLTTETVEQANRRSEADGDNKGRDAAQTAVEMANLLKRI